MPSAHGSCGKEDAHEGWIAKADDVEPGDQVLVASTAARGAMAIRVKGDLDQLVDVEAQARGPQKGGAGGARLL